MYRIEADGEVIRDEPPRIEILEPPLSASIEASQTIPIRVRVMSSAPISEVSVVYDSPTALAESSPSRVLARELSSNTYIGEVPVQRNQTDGDTWFYVTATNEKGIKVRSVTRAVHAKTTQPPPVPKIVVLKPPGAAAVQTNEPIDIKAEVKSSVPLKEVRVYFDYPRKQLSKSSTFSILKNSSSDTYIGEIPKERNRNEGYIWYFVAATPEKWGRWEIRR